MSEQLNLNNWTCFHCGETFTTPGGARDHFGATPDDVAGCLIDRVAVEKGGEPERGRGLLMALRKSEAECAALRKERDERTEERDDWRYRAQLYGEHRDEYKAQAEAAEADVLRLQAQVMSIRQLFAKDATVTDEYAIGWFDAIDRVLRLFPSTPAPGGAPSPAPSPAEEPRK